MKADVQNLASEIRRLNDRFTPDSCRWPIISLKAAYDPKQSFELKYANIDL